MPVSIKKVQNTHKNAQHRELHVALLEIVGAMNRPQRDEEIIRAAGISLDRALFPILAVAERFGPIGIVELADRVGRDHTTVSRQVAKLENLGLVARRSNPADRRVREVAMTDAGLEMTEKIDEARGKIARTIFSNWDQQDVRDLTRLVRKFADELTNETQA